MIKEANTTFPVHDLIRNRWSARAFDANPLTEETLNTLLEAASWAPSSINEQPWRYFYAFKGSPGFEKLWNCLMGGNQPWTKDAAVLMACVAKKNFEKDGKPNRHYMHDCGLANANLLLQAVSMGIYGHLMGGYEPEKAKEILGLGEEDEAVCFVALGYLGEPEQLIEPFKTREVTPRSRKPLDAISFAVE